MQTAISKLKKKSVSPDRECGVPEHLLCVLLGLEHQVGAERCLVRGEAPDAEAVDLYNEHCTLNYVLII